jgi:class 3 adenylate cyclase
VCRLKGAEFALQAPRLCRAYPLAMASGTRTNYTNTRDVEIAYQVLSEGSVDLLLYPGWTIPIDCMDEDPAMARFQRRLASFGRLIRFDPRGMGLSDRGSPLDPPTLEQWAHDALAVLDAVGSEQAVVVAPYGHSLVGITLAATHPERVASLIMLNGTARTKWAPDYPAGAPEEFFDATERVGAATDAVERGYDILSLLGPSVASDPAFRVWWDRAGNLGATPAMSLAMWHVIIEADVRHFLPMITVPTLILGARSGFFSPAHGRYLAENIQDATYVELAGSDTLYWVGDTGPMLDEIEEFVTGVRGGSGVERVLTTVLFTDIVDSTDRAAQIGDRQWRDLLDRHDQSVRSQIERFRGREVKTLGDGFVATFESPRRAIECASAVRRSLHALDLGVRAGIHTGEVEVRGDDVAGLTVHIASRVSALAAPGEVMVSSTVKDLVVGSSIEFAQRGEHQLKGVPGTWQLFAVGG